MPEPTDHIGAAKRAASMPKPETTPPADRVRKAARRNLAIGIAWEATVGYLIVFHTDLPWWSKAICATFTGVMLLTTVWLGPRGIRVRLRKDALAREQVYQVRQLDPEADPAGFGLGNLCDALNLVRASTPIPGEPLTTEEIELVRAGAVFAIEQVRSTLAEVAVTGVPEPTFRGQRWDDTAGDDGRGGFVPVSKPGRQSQRAGDRATRVQTGGLRIDMEKLAEGLEKVARDVPGPYRTPKRTGETRTPVEGRPGVCFCSTGRNGAMGHRHRYQESCFCLAGTPSGNPHHHVYVARDGDSI